jgi:acyl-CoA thioester hydrolase
MHNNCDIINAIEKNLKDEDTYMSKFNKNEITYEAFPLKTYDKIRFADTDKLGHVNNAVFSTFLETGQSEMYGFESMVKENKCGAVIVSNKLDLIGEITWPGTVEIGTAVKHIGNSAVTVLQGLFQNGKVVARAEVVVVLMDMITRKSKPLTDEMKRELNEYMIDKIRLLKRCEKSD